MLPILIYASNAAVMGDNSPRILITSSSIDEDAEVNDVVGVLSVLNGSGSYTFSITADPDSKFQIANDDELQLQATVDYETATSHSVTIEADNGVDDPISRQFTIQVNDRVEITATWDEEADDTTPDIAIEGPLLDGDTIEYELDDDSDFSSPSVQDSVTLDENTSSYDIALGELSNGTYYFRARVVRDEVNHPWCPTETITIQLYEDETVAIIEAFSTPPTTARAEAIDDLVAALKNGAVSSSNIFAKLDLLYILAAADSQAAKINWANPGSNTLTENNSPAFTADTGYTATTGNENMTPGYNPSTAGGNYAAADASAFAWSFSTGLNNYLSNTGDLRLFQGTESVASFARINGNTTPSAAARADFSGLLLGSRTSFTLLTTYLNGSSEGSSSTDVSPGSMPTSVRLLHDSGAAGGQIAIFGIGASLSANEVTDLYNALSAYLTSIGAI